MTRDELIENAFFYRRMAAGERSASYRKLCRKWALRSIVEANGGVR